MARRTILSQLFRPSAGYVFVCGCSAKQFNMKKVSIKKRNQKLKRDKPIKHNIRCTLLELVLSYHL